MRPHYLLMYSNLIFSLFMKKIILTTILLFQMVLSFAQSGTGISGKVLDAKTQKPIQNVIATIENTSLTQVTDANGAFNFANVPVGNQILKIKSDGFKEQLLQVEIIAKQILDI